MTLQRFQTLADTLSLQIQDGHLIIDENVQGINDLVGLLSLFPQRRLGLSGVAIDLQENSVAISGNWDGSFPIPGTPELSLNDVALKLTLSVVTDADAPRISLDVTTATPWVLIPDRLSIKNSALNFAVAVDADNSVKLQGSLQGTVTVDSRSYQIYLALGQGTQVTGGIEPAPNDPALRMTDVGALFGVAEALAPLDAAFDQLGFSGVQLRHLNLALDLTDLSSLSFELALSVALRELAFDAVLLFPNLWLSVHQTADIPLDFKQLLTQFQVDAPDLPALTLVGCGVEVDPLNKVLVLAAGLRGDWQLALGKTSLAFPELDLRLVAKPSEVNATLDACITLADAPCHVSLSLPSLEMGVELASGSSLSLQKLFNALVPDELALPAEAPALNFTDFALTAQPRQQTFSVRAATDDLWPLPFGQGLAIGKLNLAVAQTRSENQLSSTGTLGGTLTVGGAELQSTLTLAAGASKISITQGSAPLDLTALINGFLPSDVTLPAEVTGLGTLTLSELAGSFEFATKKYSFTAKAENTNLTLGSLSVPQATGSLEIAGTGSTIEKLKITLGATSNQDLVPGLHVTDVACVLELARTEAGAWQWHVGGSLAVGLLDLPVQTLHADASNGQFRFAMESNPALTWSLPEAADALTLRFSSLALTLNYDAATHNSSWAFAGKGGLQLADLPALSGTLELSYSAQESGFVFKADEGQGTLQLNLPIASADDRLKLGCALRADSLSLIKKTTWTLSAQSTMKVTVPAPIADSVDPIDRALALLGDLFKDTMTTKLSVTPSSAALIVSGLPQPSVPIPVLCGDQIVWDKQATVGLSQLELRIGKTISATGQLRLVFPPEINNIFGQTDAHLPKTAVLNTEWKFSISYDDKNGLSLHVDTFPFNLDATTYITTEVDGEKTWKRFTLGNIVTFRFGSFADDADGSVPWIHIDFGELGEVRFQEPHFAFDGTNFAAKGNFDIVRDLYVPTAPLRWILKQCKMDDLANLLPSAIAPLKIDVLSADNSTFDADRFIDKIRQLTTAMHVNLPGAPAFTDLTNVVRTLAGQFNQLPQDLRSYLNITLPKQLAFDIAVTPASGFGIKVDISAPEDRPLRLLIPTTDLLFTASPVPVPALYGLTIRKLSFGEVLEGSLLLVAADLDLDYFDLFSLASSLSLPASVSNLFTSTPAIQKKFIIKNFFCLVEYETAIPIPIPIYFDSLGIKYFGLEGMRTQLVLNNNLESPSLGRLLKGLLDLYKEFRAFFTSDTYTLPANLFSRNGLNLGVNVKPGFVQLPKYLGGGLLGSEDELFNLGIDSLLVPIVNYCKHPDIGKLLSVIPLQYRNGSFGADHALQLGPLKPQASWLVSTAQEFDSLVTTRSGSFVNSLYQGGTAQGDQFVALLKQVATEAATGKAHEGVIFYAQGGLQLQGVQSQIYAYAGLFVDKTHGFLTQWKLTGQAGPIVGIDMGGSFSALLQGPNQSGQRSADLSLSGSVTLTVLGHQALSASLGLQNGVFSFSSQLSLFPANIDFKAKATVTGRIDDHSLEVTGTATLALPPLPAAQADLVITQQRTTLGLSWLNQSWLLELRAQDQGQYQLSAKATTPVVVLPDLVSVINISNDAAGPELSLSGPNQPTARLDGRVSIEKFAAKGSGSVSISPQQIDATLKSSFLGWSSSISVHGTALDKPASFAFSASFEGDLFAALAGKLKDGFDLIKQAVASALSDAKAAFDREWAKFKKLVEDGASAIRAGLLDAKAKIEKLLEDLDAAVRQIIGWIGVKDEEIKARNQFLDGLSQAANASIDWLQARVNDAQHNLDHKDEEIRGLEDWYYGMDDNGRFWNALYFAGRRAQLWLERDVLPGLLKLAQDELARAKKGAKQTRNEVDSVLAELDRLRRGLASELNARRQEIVARKKELDHYNDLLELGAEQLLTEFGNTVDSTVKDAAQAVYDGAQAINEEMNRAFTTIANLSGARLPFEVQRLTVSGQLSTQQGSTFSAIGDVKVNFFDPPLVATNLSFFVDLKNPVETMKALARSIWDNRDRLQYVDYDGYVRNRDAQLLSDVSSISDARAQSGSNFGATLEGKLLQKQDWKELAAFYDYAVQNLTRFPALGDAIAVLAHFHRLLTEYQAADAEARSFEIAFPLVTQANQRKGLYLDIADPTLGAKHARRALLDEVEGLYKQRFLQRVATGSPVNNIHVDIPDMAACVFSSSNFEGTAQRLNPGRYDIGALSVGNDTVKSIWVKNGYRVRLYENAGFQGASSEYLGDQAYLGSFDNRTSSLVVECLAFAPPQLSAWARSLPVAGSPVWQSGFRVRYAIAYEFADGSLSRGDWWAPPGADANGYINSDAYTCPILGGISCDSSNQAVARRIYRQFYSLPERMIHRIPNNTDTQWVDTDLGIQDYAIPQPGLALWMANLPVDKSPVWQPNYQVRYAVAYEFSDGSIHRTGWWSPTGGGVTADAFGYYSTNYACPSLNGISIDSTGQAVARLIYRQFRGRAERLIHRIPNNIDTTWTDDDKGIMDQPLQAPNLARWSTRVPVPESAVWQPGYAVRYAVAFEFPDGRLHRSAWWCPVGSVIPADREGYVTGNLACPVLSDLPCDGTGQAVARVIYRQFRGRSERMIARISNNTDTSYADNDLELEQLPNAVTGAFVIGTDHNVYNWNGTDWTACSFAAGTRIAVGPSGQVFLVNSNANNSIWRRDANKWTQIPGAALDIAIAGDGTVYILGTDNNIYKWNGSDWSATGGSGTRIVVGANGTLFVINANAGNSIWYRDGGGWAQIPGAAFDIAIAGDGTLYVIGTDSNIYQWNGSGWSGINGSGTRIAVGANGTIFVLNANAGNSIWRREGSGWTQVSGAALDIMVGCDGCLYMLGLDHYPYKWNGTSWTGYAAFGTRLAASSSGQLFVLNSADNNKIWRRDGISWTQLPGSALDIAIGGDGNPYVLGVDHRLYQWGGADWTVVTGADNRVAVSPTGQLFTVKTDNTIWRRDDNGWTQLPDAALDIAMGSDGNSYVLGMDRNVYKWNGGGWVPFAGSETRIVAGPSGQLFVLNAADHSIWRREGNSWKQIPGAALDIAIGSDGNVYVLGTDNNIYQLNAGGWAAVGGSGTRIALGPSGKLFVVNATAGNTIWRRDGNDWTQIPGAALDIAIGLDGNPYVLGTDHNVYQWNGSNWIPLNGAGTRIVMGRKGQLFVLNANVGNSIWRRDGNSWTQLPGAALDLAIADDGTPYILGMDRNVYAWKEGGWSLLPGAGARIAAGSNGQIFVVNQNSTIWRCDSNGRTSIPGSALDLAIGGDGAVYILGTDNNFVKWNGTSWIGLGISGTRIAVDPTGNLFALKANAGNTIWRRDRNSDSNGWTQLPGTALDIAIGGDGNPYRLGVDRNLYQWNGSDWTPLGSTGTRIAAGPTGQVFMINANAKNSIWRRDGSSWTQLAGAALDIAIGVDGNPYVLGTDNNIYRWDGTSFVQVQGAGNRIAVSPTGQLYAVNSNNQIWLRTGSTWRQLSGAAVEIAVGGLSAPTVPAPTPLRSWLPSKLALRDSNGKYVSAATNGQPVVADHTAIGETEKFVSFALGSGKFALLSRDGNYLSPDSKAGSRLTPVRFTATAAEILTAYDLGNDTVALQAANGLYVQSLNSGIVSATASTLQTATRFQLVDYSLESISLVGVGMDNRLYRRTSLCGPWESIFMGATLLGLTRLSDDSILTVGMDNKLYTMATFAGPLTPVLDCGAVYSVTGMPDGSIVGVGMDNQLYRRPSLSSPWESVPNNNIKVKSVTSQRNGTLIAVGMDNQLYRRSLSTAWESVPNNNIAVIAATALLDGSLYGVGLTNQLCRRATLNSPWEPISGSGSVLAIASFNS